MTFHYSENGRPWDIVVGPEKISRCFNDALCGPLHLAAEKIAYTSNLKDVNPRVVVSGRTSRNPALQSRLRDICAEERLADPIFTDTFEMKEE